MILEENFALMAPIEQVWDFFLDIERLAPCVPGVENVQQLDPANYKGVLKLKVGPIGVAFRGDVTIVEQEPPRFIRVKLQGRDVAGLVQGEFTSTLTPTENGETAVAYRMDIALRGRLAQFGQAVIRDTARKMTAEFVSCVQKKLEPTNA
ncbi:MAG: hypothetical protein D6791_11685 [Chloroflexi bacterium]|nr:MAG: hypothetical protein D6791_11685 [Chloroflexota bacterium]